MGILETTSGGDSWNQFIRVNTQRKYYQHAAVWLSRSPTLSDDQSEKPNIFICV